MSQLFQKVAQFLANELVTKRLANSQTFMSAAHKTHQTVQKSKQVLKDGQKIGVEQAKEHGKGVFGFLGEVKNELLKDLNQVVKK